MYSTQPLTRQECETTIEMIERHSIRQTRGTANEDITATIREDYSMMTDGEPFLFIEVVYPNGQTINLDNDADIVKHFPDFGGYN